MSTQNAVLSSYGRNQNRPVPKHLRKAAHLREEVFRYIGDAIDARTFADLHTILTRYLTQVPVDVQHKLDILEYGSE